MMVTEQKHSAMVVSVGDEFAMCGVYWTETLVP